MDWLNMELSPNLAFVAGIRTGISRIAYNFGFNEREAYHIEMVVDELCSNAIEYGSKKKLGGKVRLECKFFKNRLEFTVRDYGGKKFDVEEILERGDRLTRSKPNAGCLPEATRGRGLSIVRKLVDRFDIKTGKSGTLVMIVKKRTPNES